MSAISQKSQVLLGKLAMVHTLVIPVLGRLRQEDCLKTKLGYMETLPQRGLRETRHVRSQQSVDRNQTSLGLET